MMMRLLLTIWLMMAMLMPCAWAGEKEIPSSALSQVTITAEDWVEGDMYHIRYTFTNPTDEMIDETIDFIEIRYDYHNYTYENNLGTRTQYDETVSRLTIAPHSSYTTTVSLKQPFPSAFNRLMHSTFYFKDDSYLFHSISLDQPKSPFSLLPNVSPTGDVSLTIRNDSPTETITELRKILIIMNLQGDQRFTLRTEPYPLTVKPNETTKIPLCTLTNSDNKEYPDISYYISMDINGIPHYYNNVIDTTDTFEIRFKTQYCLSMEPQKTRDSIFYLDESNLYAYIQIQGRHKEPISAPNASYIFNLDYFDKNACSRTQDFRVYLPPDFCLGYDETKYFSFKIPLPADYRTLNPHKPIRFYTYHLDLAPTYLYPPSKLSLSAPKEQYVPLTNIKNKDPRSLFSNP